MKKNSYLCTEKMVPTMNRMKVAVLVAAFAAMPVCLQAQSQGVGVTVPQATFHVHSYTEYEDPELPIFPNGDGLNSGGNGATLDPDYATTLLLTNTNTGAAATDGLLIRQFNNDITIKQQEAGIFQIVNSNGGGKFIMNSVGNFGLGNTYTGIKFNVEGSGRFTGSVRILSWASIAGTLTVGRRSVSVGWSDADSMPYTGSARTYAGATLGNLFGTDAVAPSVSSATRPSTATSAAVSGVPS